MALLDQFGKFSFRFGGGAEEKPDEYKTTEGGELSAPEHRGIMGAEASTEDFLFLSYQHINLQL